MAGTVNLQGAGVFYGRYWGAFEDVRFLHFNVCYYAAIEHCIGQGITRFEPGAGGEYKWLRGFDPAVTRSMHFITHGGLRKAIANFLTRETPRSRSMDRRGQRTQPAQAPRALECRIRLTLPLPAVRNQISSTHEGSY